ncbi:MAG: hypothetical protein HY076_00760 [Candidatus Eisenbacteria bacterium]|uniref:Uncharacterized protein n=1 Tax=Eiseniibacteriota bacterium TaxID=2212470 RepID=A0A9D6QJ30_UNCEI|nr:hypothetical protein [Candidatus Eisenbacteria bacterium]MBI3538791.1 hypothetical protein [Candidatus Eisenbacteria bacterium]
MSGRARSIPLLLALALAALAPQRACAGTEEFSTFSVEEQERDDESLLDHVMSRTPEAWETEWCRAPLALRTGQGCLTSGQWFTSIDAKLRASMARNAWFGLTFTDRENDAVDYQFVDFSFHLATRFGTPYFMFRPFHDKSRQDFALGLDVGADTTVFQMSAVLGLEDFFNNLWAFRQTTLGQTAEPFVKHPFEPALSFAVHRPAWRAEMGGRYLTPQVKRIIVSYAFPDLDHLTTLWGSYVWGSLEARTAGFDWTIATVNHQAKSGVWTVGTPNDYLHDYRRQWSLETTLTHALAAHWAAEWRGLYQERTGNVESATVPRAFAGTDRMMQIEARYARDERFTVRFGALRDRVTVYQPGYAIPNSQGSRYEDRAYVGVGFKLGRVSMQGVEGLRLFDKERYVLTNIHDKGFLQLQSTF